MPKDLIDLTPDDCRFPVTDEPPHAFCGNRAISGEPYCAHHQMVCYNAEGRRQRFTISRVGFKLAEELQPIVLPKPIEDEIILDVMEALKP